MKLNRALTKSFIQTESRSYLKLSIFLSWIDLAVRSP